MKVVEFNKLKEILVGNGIETVFEIYGNGQFKLHISFKNFGRTYDFKYPTTPYEVLETVVFLIGDVFPHSKKLRPLKKIIREQSFHDYEKKDNGYSKENLPFNGYFVFR